MGKLFSFFALIIDGFLLRKPFLTLEEINGKVKVILENTKGEELQRIKVKVTLPEGLSVKQIRVRSKGKVKVENGSIDWSLDTLGKQDRQILEFSMSSSSVKTGGGIEFISEPLMDESYYFDKQGLHWKIYSPQTHKVRTLLYRINAKTTPQSEFAWKIEV